MKLSLKAHSYMSVAKLSAAKIAIQLQA